MVDNTMNTLTRTTATRNKGRGLQTVNSIFTVEDISQIVPPAIVPVLAEKL